MLKRFPVKPLKRGGSFDFFGFLKKIGTTIQKGFDLAAPITSKLVGPITTSLTGVTVPNPSDILQNGPSALLPAAKLILEKNENNPSG